jgi:putative addiction module killer protein
MVRTIECPAAAKIAMALYRLEQGNTSVAKPVGGGVHELRIDFGPGYRVYFGSDGAKLVILLGGGSKKRQGHDISAAQDAWGEYRRRKARS